MLKIKIEQEVRQIAEQQNQKKKQIVKEQTKKQTKKQEKEKELQQEKEERKARERIMYKQWREEYEKGYNGEEQSYATIANRWIAKGYNTNPKKVEREIKKQKAQDKPEEQNI